MPPAQDFNLLDIDYFTSASLGVCPSGAAVPIANPLPLFPSLPYLCIHKTASDRYLIAHPERACLAVQLPASRNQVIVGMLLLIEPRMEFGFHHSRPHVVRKLVRPVDTVFDIGAPNHTHIHRSNLIYVIRGKIGVIQPADDETADLISGNGSYFDAKAPLGKADHLGVAHWGLNGLLKNLRRDLAHTPIAVPSEQTDTENNQTGEENARLHKTSTIGILPILNSRFSLSLAPLNISGRRDLNSRPLGPEPSALAKLSHFQLRQQEKGVHV